MTPGSELDRKLLAAIERLGRALRGARQKIATEHGLSQLGVQILELLNDGRVRRVGDLADELDIGQPTASDALATLESRGLLVRGRNPGDRRSTTTSLTADGARLADAIATDLAPIRSSGLDATVERATALRVLLEEIVRLRSAGVVTVDRCCLSCHHYDQRQGSAHCLLLDMPLTDASLRVDCADHETSKHR